MSDAKLFWVVRPDDKMVVPLTCTDEQLQVWLDKGYKLEKPEKPAKPQAEAGSDNS